jgi:hypothetical protein
MGRSGASWSDCMKQKRQVRYLKECCVFELAMLWLLLLLQLACPSRADEIRLRTLWRALRPSVLRRDM